MWVNLQDPPGHTCGVPALRGGCPPSEQQRRLGQSLEPMGREAAPHGVAGRRRGTCRNDTVSTAQQSPTEARAGQARSPLT